MFCLPLVFSPLVLFCFILLTASIIVCIWFAVVVLNFNHNFDRNFETFSVHKNKKLLRFVFCVHFSFCFIHIYVTNIFVYPFPGSALRPLTLLFAIRHSPDSYVCLYSGRGYLFRFTKPKPKQNSFVLVCPKQCVFFTFWSLSLCCVFFFVWFCFPPFLVLSLSLFAFLFQEFSAVADTHQFNLSPIFFSLFRLNFLHFFFGVIHLYNKIRLKITTNEKRKTETNKSYFLKHFYL